MSKEAEVRTELDFLYECGEDYHLWDEEEKGDYPVERILSAMNKRIGELKSHLSSPQEVKLPSEQEVMDYYVAHLSKSNLNAVDRVIHITKWMRSKLNK